MEHIFYNLMIWGVILIAVFIYCQWEKWADEESQEEFDGKKYRYMCVGMDMDRSFRDSVQYTIGNISKSELKRRDKNGTYAINAWVQVGFPTYSWKEEPINRETWLRFAEKGENLPKYLQEESGCLTIEQYRKKMQDKVTG